MKWFAPKLAALLTAAALCAPGAATAVTGDFRGIWGSSFSFAEPVAIDTDNVGNVYVADTNNHRVSVFDANGQTIRQWGTFGAANGQFQYPSDIFYDDTNAEVYVADTANNRVQVFSSSGEYVRSFGTPGVLPGEFSDPMGVHVDAAGRVYVVDSTNSRIQVFSRNGAFLAMWGNNGTGDAQFRSPHDITTDSQGNIYVADTGNNRIQIFDSRRVFVKRFGIAGYLPGQFRGPTGISIGPSNRLYIADSGNNRIQVFDTVGNYVSNFGVFGIDAGQFDSPRGVSVDSTGKIHVADTLNNRIQIFTNAGSFLSRWSAAGDGPGQFDYPYHLAVDRTGKVFAVDQNNGRVQVFDATGTLSMMFASLGSGPGQLTNPTGIAIHPDTYDVYISDTGNNRINVYTQNGAFLSSFGAPGTGNGQFNAPHGITFGPNRLLYVADRLNHRVQVFDANGVFQNKWGTYGTASGELQEPIGVTIPSNSKVYVLSYFTHNVHIFSLSGVYETRFAAYGTTTARLRYPCGISSDRDNNIYVADTDNHRVHVFNDLGAYRKVWGRLGVDPGMFTAPSGITVGTNATVYVADSGNNRIQLFEAYNSGYVNDPPVFESIADIDGEEGQLVQFTLTATDPEGGVLTFSAENLPPGSNFNATTRTFTWLPDFNASGTYANVTFRVSDDGSPMQVVTQMVTMVIRNVNRPPVLQAIGNRTGSEGQPLTFTLNASDPDGNRLTYTALNLPAGAILDANSGVFSWATDYNDSGNYPSITFTVADDGIPPYQDSETITITVLEVNRNPALDPIADQEVNEGDTLTFTAGAADPDGDIITYSGLNLPSGASINPTTGVFTWIVGFTQEGTYSNVRITATDNGAPPMVDHEYFTIRVYGNNRAPVFAPMDPIIENEGVPISIDLPASDPDGHLLTFTAVGMPPGSTLGQNSGLFQWTPAPNQAGDYQITFTATDNGAPPRSVSQTLVLTITDNNNPPVFTPVGNHFGTEGQIISFSVNATDPDGDAVTIRASNLPQGAAFNFRTGLFSWMPSWGQSGTYSNITFTATDDGAGALQTTEVVTVTVSDTNRPPVFDYVEPQEILEGQTLIFSVTATDPDGHAISFSPGSLPTGASFSGATGTFTWTPGYDQAGVYVGVELIATDNGTPPASTIYGVTINVKDVNRAPIIQPIGNQTIGEGNVLVIDVVATDPDGDAMTYSVGNLPLRARFDPVMRRFTWRPGYDQAGEYANVQFVVADDGLPSAYSIEPILIKVTNHNQPPEMETITDKVVAEGEQLRFQVRAVDPDGDTMVYSVSGLPDGAAFTASTRTFDWTPAYNQAGDHTITFIATDTGTPPYPDAYPVLVTVTDVNQAPTFAPISAITALEDQLLSFVLDVTDVDGNNLTLSAANLPGGAAFDAGTGTFSWTPTTAQGGVYVVTFGAVDDGTPSKNANLPVTITVTDANRAPTFDLIGNKATVEGRQLEFTIHAIDPDGDTVGYSATDLPAGAFLDPVTGTFSWTPTFDGAGSYTVTFTASDFGSPAMSSNQTVTITVADVNRAPVFTRNPPGAWPENEVITFQVSATDPDSDPITYRAGGLPPGSTFNAATQTFTWQPGYDQAGSYYVFFFAADNGVPPLEASLNVPVTVLNSNRPPVITPIGNKTVTEGEVLTFGLTATDADGEQITFSAGNLPAGATFNSETGVFAWPTNFSSAGVYENVYFIATDNGVPQAATTEAITVTVNNTNRPPTVATIGSKTVTEGQILTFQVRATDPDNDPLTYTATNLPPGSTFDPATATFSWTPNASHAGQYPGITFTAADNATPSLADSEAITIYAINVNLPPVLNPIGSKVVPEGQTLVFSVFASDPENHAITYSATGLPPGASFDAPSGTFSWTPSFEQIGTYPDAYFTATDNGDPPLSDTERVTITVSDTNRPPVLQPIGPQLSREGTPIELLVTASDPDGNLLRFTVNNLPDGASFSPTTQKFRWIPRYDQAATYDIEFIVTDDGLPPMSDTEVVSFIIGDANRSPEIVAIQNQMVAEGEVLQVTVIARDPDGDTMFYTVENLPPGAVFNSAEHTFFWPTTFDQSGNYPDILFHVTDDGDPPLTSTEAMRVTVTAVNRVPTITPITDKTIGEGETLNFPVTGSDPDVDQKLVYRVASGPSGCYIDTFTNRFIWTPSYSQAGTYTNVLVTVTDNGTPLLSDMTTFTITVEDREPPLTVYGGGNRWYNENQQVTFALSVLNVTNAPLVWTNSALPDGATWDPNTLTFSWRPTYDQGGGYNLWFRATDAGVPTRTAVANAYVYILNVNRAPVLDPVSDQQVVEGYEITFAISATDPDGDLLDYNIENLPAGATFDSATGILTWTPALGQAGVYNNLVASVTDRSLPNLSDSVPFTITVLGGNRPPVLDFIGNRSSDEMQTISFTVNATDPDGNNLTYDAANLPTGATFSQITRQFSWTPTYAQAGVYPNIVFTVTDDGFPPATAEEAITISVGNVNRPPYFVAVAEPTVLLAEGEQYLTRFTAIDPDGNTISYSGSNMPTGAVLSAASGNFSWTPGFLTEGTYPDITITATDNALPSQSATYQFTIVVGNANRPPVLATIGDRTVNEGATLEFLVTAVDPDGDTLTYDAANLPSGATFDPSTRMFSWTPDFEQAGQYPLIEFSVYDSGTPMKLDTTLITITVSDVNRAPVFLPVGTVETLEGLQMQFTVLAVDYDGHAITYAATALPTGASFDPVLRMFTWMPTFDQAGIYVVTFEALDDGVPPATGSTDVTISVGDITAESLAQQIIDTVLTIDLDQQTEESYLRNLEKVGPFMDLGQIQAAISQLTVFISKVERDIDDGDISPEDGAILITQAQELIAILETQLPP